MVGERSADDNPGAAEQHGLGRRRNQRRHPAPAQKQQSASAPPPLGI